MTPCPWARRRAFLREFKQRLAQYLEENPQTGFSDIRTEFGEPEEIAGSFIEQLDTGKIRKSLKWGRRTAALVLAIAAVTAVVLIGIHVYNAYRADQLQNGFFIETITEDEAPVSLKPYDETKARVY